MHENEHEIDKLIQQGETLMLEFKSDLKCLSDRDLVAAVVSLANTEGGELLLGVEDDGTVTGLHTNHLAVSGLPSRIANKTNPAISVRVERYDPHGKSVARIIVPRSRQLVSTSDGLLLCRRLKLDGTPEAVPFYPHEFIQRQSSMGLVDPTAMVLEDIDVRQLDPLQRQRIRNAIKKYGGEQSLLALADDELDGALGALPRGEWHQASHSRRLAAIGNGRPATRQSARLRGCLSCAARHGCQGERVFPQASAANIRGNRASFQGQGRRRRNPGRPFPSAGSQL